MVERRFDKDENITYSSREVGECNDEMRRLRARTASEYVQMEANHGCVLETKRVLAAPTN